MNVRRTRLLLWSIAAIGAACALGIVADGLWVPCQVPQDAPIDKTIATTRPADALPPLATFQAAYLVDLQRPLFDAAQNAAAQQPLQLKLTGTIMDPGHSQAVLATPDGKSELKGVGESLAGAQILKIEDGSATVSYNGQTIVLRVQKGSSP